MEKEEQSNAQDPSGLPKHVIAQLQEHSNGGYILFRITLDGEVGVELSFDNEMSYLALGSKARSILAALKEIDTAGAYQMLTGQNEGAEDEDGEDDDEDDYA